MNLSERVGDALCVVVGLALYVVVIWGCMALVGGCTIQEVNLVKYERTEAPSSQPATEPAVDPTVTDYVRWGLGPEG